MHSEDDLQKSASKNAVEPLCIRLKELRRYHNVSLQSIHQSTGIATHHLQALEDCRYNDLPCGAVRKTILKNYLSALSETGIHIEDHPEFIALPTSVPKKKASPWYSFFSLSPRGWIFALLTVCITLYLGFEVDAMISPPRLSILLPVDNSTTSSQTVVLSGSTTPESVVSINGVHTLLSREGNFSETIHLKEGLNEFIISSETKRGGKTNLSRKIFYNP